MDITKAARNKVGTVSTITMNTETTQPGESNKRWKKVLLSLRVVKSLRLTEHIPEEQIVITRSNKFKDIFLNKCRDKIHPKFVVYSFTGILLSMLFTTTMTHWPQHDVIEDPKYWYECMLVIATGYAPIASANIVFSCFGH